MAEKEVAEALYSLRREVETLEGQQPELKDGLESLLTKLEARLEAGEAADHLHLVDDMKSTLTKFEVEHPTLTGVLNQLMVALSNIGV